MRISLDDRLRVSGEVSRGERMALRGTDPESCITECTSVYEDEILPLSVDAEEAQDATYL